MTTADYIDTAGMTDDMIALHRVAEAYRMALCFDLVAKNREHFRNGRIVVFEIDEETGFSDGLPPAARKTARGEFQLRYGVPGTYGVFGRVDREGRDKNDGWTIMAGPWRIGEGPFDNTRACFDLRPPVKHTHKSPSKSKRARRRARGRKPQ